ncbi:hypothetical protein ACOMHN_016720 [Nucella lapillus]
MQSCWKELTDLHTFLTPTAVHTIDPKSWCSIISRTLSSLSCSDETKRPVSTELCQHCHQMVALSAVTTMALLAQDRREGHSGVEDVYLQPLLQPDLLKCMVALLQHRCQYLRRQSQKALTALSSLKRLTESMAEDLAGRCVRAVLHLTLGDVRGVEPLQLLCTLLSARSACVHRVRVADTLLPCLPALYRRVVCNAPSEPGYGVWLAAAETLANHAALFSSNCSRQSGDHLIVERKFLDIVDTTMDYIWLRTSKTLDGVYKEMAVRFVRCMLAADCPWSFPGQRTLIGGQCDQAGCGGDHPHGSTSLHGSGSKGAEELLGAEHSGDRSPVLVLLLAAVFKACAIVFRSERGNTEQGEQMRACASLLCSMHSHLQQLFGAGWGVERGTGGSPTCITWLAQVCGDQDDRWIEALLCALDIFLCLPVLSAASSGVLHLRTLLDPHALFLQLLDLTHYNASLIIDWLTSPETCYLAYLTQYLRLLATDFSTFMRVASSSDMCRGSGSPPMYEDSRRVMKESEEGGSGKETSLVKRGPSSLSVQRHKLGVAAPGCSLVQEHPVSGPGVGPHECCLSESSEPDQNTDAGRLDKARESSLGMVLLSCYEDDSSVDDTGDESCDEESFSDAATDNSTEHEDKNEACWGKHGTITEDEVKPSQSRGGSTGSETYCSDGDDNSLINPSVSQTEMQRTCPSSHSEHPYSPSPAKPQIVHAERMEIRHNCHTACLDRVMRLLGEVRVKLEKLDRSGLLVYNPSPLVSLVRTCEGLFERQNGL